MKKMLLLCGAMLAISAAAAFAQTTAPGLDLAWGGCLGDNGTLVKSFACTSTANGTQSFTASWVPDVTVPLFNGAEIFVNVAVQGGATPAWWGTACAGRAAVFTANTTIAGTAVNCADIWAGGGAGGVSAFNQDWHGAGTVQVDIAAAVATGSEQEILPGGEYFLFNVLLSTNKSAPAGNCTGCLIPACLNFKELRWTQPAPAPQVTTTQGGAQPYIYWQNASASCVQATPTHNTTWGSVKALYR
jgi:hypothetical protein